MTDQDKRTVLRLQRLAGAVIFVGALALAGHWFGWRMAVVVWAAAWGERLCGVARFVERDGEG